MPGKLAEYKAKRDFKRTSEPGAKVSKGAKAPLFVVQEHHARALHWDFRLERDGVLVSWAVPKGLPLDRGVRRLAVHTEDHPLEYATFEGEIPSAEYGGGAVTVWDTGRYETEKWSDGEIMVVLHGQRAQGRYVLIHTGAKNWLMQRMAEPDGQRLRLPELVSPMLAVPGPLPADDAGWGFEFKWDGVRAVGYVDGGRMRLLSRHD